MSEVTKVTICYDKTDGSSREITESFALSFTVDMDSTYHVILEKVEIMLKSMGFEAFGHLEFASEIQEEYSNEDHDNVVQLRPVTDDEEQ